MKINNNLFIIYLILNIPFNLLATHISLGESSEIRINWILKDSIKCTNENLNHSSITRANQSVLLAMFDSESTVSFPINNSEYENEEAPSIPNLFYPENNAIDVERSLTLIWNRSEGAINYSVLVSEKDSFNILFINQKNITDTTLSVEGLSYRRTYYWKVKAYSISDSSDWSEIHSFYTGGQTIFIEDANLEAKIRNAVYYHPTGVLRTSDLFFLNYLYAVTSNIYSLVGLEYATNLNYVELRGNHISNLEPLENLKYLYSLDLVDNDIENINPLSGLPAITSLNLGYNHITNIDSISYFSKGLETLNLSGNNIEKIDSIEKLVNLEFLNINSNKISDLSGYSGNIHLKYLDLSYNNIRTFPTIQNLNELEELYLWDNFISDISGIQNLKELRILNLDFNEILDLTPLQNLPALKDLSMVNAKIKSLDDLKDLPQLESLVLDSNVINDFKTLENLPSLAILSLRSCDLYEVRRLPYIQSLDFIDISDNRITNLNNFPLYKSLSYLLIEDNYLQFDDFIHLYDLDRLIYLSLLNNICEFSEESMRLLADSIDLLEFENIYYPTGENCDEPLKAITQGATNILKDQATIGVFIDFNPSITDRVDSIAFEYGNESGIYHSKLVMIESVSTDKLLSCNIMNLLPDTIYYYRTVAFANNKIRYFGEEKSFSTLSTIINDAFNHSLKIYPNPNRGLFYIENIGTVSNKIRLSVFDMCNRKLDPLIIYDNNQIKIDISNYPPGLYFINYVQDNNVYSHSIIICN